MILPTKHLSLNESLLGGGAILLQALSAPQTISGLWEKVRKDAKVGNYKRFTLLLDFLYAIDAIYLEDDLLKRRARA